jgi:hypothetical protein
MQVQALEHLFKTFTSKNGCDRCIPEQTVGSIIVKQPVFLQMKKSATCQISSLFVDLLSHAEKELASLQTELQQDRRLELCDMSSVLEILTEQEQQEIAEEGLRSKHTQAKTRMLNPSMATKIIMAWVQLHSKRRGNHRWLREYFDDEEYLFLFLCDLALKSVSQSQVNQIETLRLQVSADAVFDGKTQREIAYPIFQRCKLNCFPLVFVSIHNLNSHSFCPCKVWACLTLFLTKS